MAASDHEEAVELPSGALAVIAQPLAGKKLHKKLLKMVKKAAKEKALKRGVKEVIKAIRKNAKGIVILAGDISPIDVLTHIPIVCEEAKIPYIYVPSKTELGIAAATKRATCCILVVTPTKSSAEYREYFDYCAKEISN